MAQRRNPYLLFALIGCIFAATVLVVAYVAIAFYTGNPWPWLEIVHETGDRTLLGTILYYEHAARELPLDLLLGMAVAGSALFVFPGRKAGSVSSGTGRRRFGIALLAVSAIIVGGTLWTGGLPMLSENLLQYPTRPGEPLKWGGHWRYHLLSHVTLMLVSFGLAALVILGDPRRKGRGHRRGLAVFTATVGVFGTLALVFGFNLDPFTDPVALGHQAREAFTHSLVTIPAAWGVCLLCARREWGSPSAAAVPLGVPVGIGAGGVLAGIFLVVSSLVKSSASQGQTDSLVLLIFPHFFEHVFSYIVACLAAGFVFESFQNQFE
jgi:hypothetical protein